MGRVKPYRYLFACGHYVESESQHTVCSKCGCEEIKFIIKSNTYHLEGRKAKCGNRFVKSRWDLPGFVYRPDEEYDLYLFGNRDNVNSNGFVYNIKKYADEVRKDRKKDENPN